MGKIACCHPGKIGDALYSLPTIRELCRRRGMLADFYTSEYCRPLLKLMQNQTCIDRALVCPGYTPANFGCGGQPWRMPIPPGYDAVYQLGFRESPPCALPDYIAGVAGLPPNLPLTYDFEPTETLDEPFIVVAPWLPGNGYSELFREVAETSPVAVVEIGGAGEVTGSKRSVDLTGRDMYDTLPWLARSSGFVGLMSSQLVLANGFAIPRVSPHDGKSWDMNHVVRSPLNHYPVVPTAREVLKLLGVGMTYCKTIELDDYNVIHETQHAVNIKNLLGTFQNRFEHPHRAWEYGLVLRALREYGCQNVLDVGGGGSLFGPTAAWLDMRVIVVDPCDYGEWTHAQAMRIGGKKLHYVQQDFLDFELDEKFDAVTCISVLEHVEDDAAFFKRLASYVKPGGLLAVTVDFWPDGEQKSGGHIRTYSKKSLTKLAKSVKDDFKPVGKFDYDHADSYVYGYTFASLILRRQ